MAREPTHTPRTRRRRHSRSIGIADKDSLGRTNTNGIRRTPNGTIRRSLQESDINLQPVKRGGSAGGLLIVKRKGAAPDTLYQDLSSREAFRMMSEFTALQRAEKTRKARDSTSK